MDNFQNRTLQNEIKNATWWGARMTACLMMGFEIDSGEEDGDEALYEALLEKGHEDVHDLLIELLQEWLEYDAELDRLKKAEEN